MGYKKPLLDCNLCPHLARFVSTHLKSSEPKNSQGPVTLLEVTRLICSCSLSRSQVGLRGPRALDHVFGKRFCLELTETNTWIGHI